MIWESEESAYEIAVQEIKAAILTGKKELDLSNLWLVVLPPEIGGLNQLISLNLKQNQLSNLPSEIGQLANLTSLNLEQNRLSSLPAEIGQLVNLTSLNLEKNQLSNLPAEIGQLVNLTSLNLEQNRLSSLPAEIGQLVNLTSLNLEKNQIVSLPSEIKLLAKLSSLKLLNNPLVSLSISAKQLFAIHPPNLNSLFISDDQENFLGTTNFDLYKPITSLELKDCLLQDLHPSFFTLANLKFLSIINSRSRSNTLPNELWKMNNLIQLEINNSEFTYVPAEIGNLHKLQQLSLNHNKLTYFPSTSFLKLVSLETFSAFDNMLERIPPELGQLHRLKSLDLRNNRLVEIPLQICQLRNLSDLNLENNQLTSLPADIGHLTNLTKLYLGNNQLTSLPKSLWNIKTLETLDLRNNPLSIPPEILEKINEPYVILDYLAQLGEKNRQPLAETKMLVVGQGSVGKTSVIQRLLNNEFNLQETKTAGITINCWLVANTEVDAYKFEKLRINIWDFGGQEIMHATHQFFLTRRSLYLLVLDARLTQEENRVEYWLKIIQSFGGDSPVLLVGNKTDQHPLDIDRTGLRKKYPNIVGILETSAATGAGIEALRAAITEQVNILPHVRDLLPESWFNVKNQLEELGRVQNYISQEKYAETCVAGEISDETSQRTLIGFLHDLGIVLHFQDDPRLEALGILNPQWVTNGVYKILNAHALFQNKGVLEQGMLDQILDFPEYPASKRLFIIDMMRKFELCYDLESDKTFLVPDLLPKDEPFTGEWKMALAFQYHYNVLPSSIISRFIVRMNAYIHKTVWRTGVVLKNNGNTALVKADSEERKIYIWVNGTENTRRDFLAAIRAEFDAIHKTIIKIEATPKVPHPGYPELILDYPELLQFERDGIAEFPRSVGGKTITVSVRQLLNGVREENQASPLNTTQQSNHNHSIASPPPYEPFEYISPKKWKWRQYLAGTLSLLVALIILFYIVISTNLTKLPILENLISNSSNAETGTWVLSTIFASGLLTLLGSIGWGLSKLSFSVGPVTFELNSTSENITKYIFGLFPWGTTIVMIVAVLVFALDMRNCESPIADVNVKTSGNLTVEYDGRTLIVPAGAKISLEAVPVGNVLCEWSYTGQAIKSLSSRSSCITQLILADQPDSNGLVTLTLSRDFCPAKSTSVFEISVLP